MHLIGILGKYINELGERASWNIKGKVLWKQR